ncbi:hypothetical protein ACCC98_14250 [Rhizobium pisi]|uniref:hypothetical protein n=1 Tax=Rhizobium pisi TaxID=574561 RepID=UPI0039B09CBD
MLNDRKFKDILRTLIIGATVFCFAGLYLYLKGWLSAVAIQIVLGVLVAATLFDLYWLSWKRSRQKSAITKRGTPLGDRKRQIKLGRLAMIAIATAVLAIQMSGNLWALLG